MGFFRGISVCVCVCVWIRLICSNRALKVEVEGNRRIKQRWRNGSDCEYQFKGPVCRI